jgi:MFS transporter, MFS domain-containing protein family, molybdate-anion transporter
MWVPTLLQLKPPGGVPTGCVFSALMMTITMGGLLFPPLQSFIGNMTGSKESANEASASLTYLLASISMAIPAICLSSELMEKAGGCLARVVASFMVVEFCVGLFMPVAGTLRSKYVPDALQGGILNIFRLPLNTVVVAGTYATDVLETSKVFMMVSGCFLAAALLQASMIPTANAAAKAKKD